MSFCNKIQPLMLTNLKVWERKLVCLHSLYETVFLNEGNRYLDIFKCQLVWVREYVLVVFTVLFCKHSTHFHEAEGWDIIAWCKVWDNGLNYVLGATHTHTHTHTHTRI